MKLHSWEIAPYKSKNKCTIFKCKKCGCESIHTDESTYNGLWRKGPGSLWSEKKIQGCRTVDAEGKETG